MSLVRVTYPVLDREQVIERLRQACIGLRGRLPISKMILYGSYAVGRYTAGSDVDVIVVYEGSPRDDAFKLVVDEVGLPRLEPRVYTEEQFNALIAASPRFAEILEKEGIVLFEAHRK